MKRSILQLILFFVFAMFVAVLPSAVQAKLLPRFTSSGSGASTRTSAASSKSVVVTPRFLPARNGLRVAFNGLSNAKSVSYMLTYTTNGKEEGVTGSVDPSANSTSRELLFGTCSSGVCVNHGKIVNMKLEITSQLKSGKTSIKRYKIRV